MNIDNIRTSLAKSRATGFDLHERRSGKPQLIVPILHEDGDMVDIYLQDSPKGKDYIRICDFGMTLMRLSYSYDVNTDVRWRVFDNILINNGVKNDDGNLYLDTSINALYESVLRFAGCVQKVCNMRHWDREVVRGAFHDDIQKHATTNMKIINTVADFRAAQREYPRPLGLVPTMGYLHEGHLSLVRRCRADNATAVASVFVNPTQFGPSEDLSTYPRDMEGDLAKLEAEGVDLVFAPDASEMYPRGFSATIDVGEIARRLEGERRPGHFQGVATVVCKLLTIVRPDRVYFGQKDAQQCLVVRRLNADLNLGAEIVVMPTIRDSDGLALSSRNAYLSDEDRDAALSLYRALSLAESLYADGVRDAAAMRRDMLALLEAEPRASVEYVSVADAETLVELNMVDRPALVSLAVRVGGVRLIDNIVLGTPK